MAAFETAVANSIGETPDNEPPKVPIAVLALPKIKISSLILVPSFNLLR